MDDIVGSLRQRRTILGVGILVFIEENEETNKMVLDEEDCLNQDKLNEQMKETKENLQYEDDFDDEYEKEDKFEVEESCSEDYESCSDDYESNMMQESKNKL